MFVYVREKIYIFSNKSSVYKEYVHTRDKVYLRRNPNFHTPGDSTALTETAQNVTCWG